MAIQIKKYQTGRSARVGGLPAPPLQKATLPVGNTAEDQNVKSMIASASGASKQFVNQAIKDAETKRATDVLDEYNDYYEKTRQFEENYMDLHKGKNAEGYDELLERYHTEESSKRLMRFSGNPQQEHLAKQKFSQLKNTSMTRGYGYMNVEEKRYKKETTDATSAIFLQKVGETDDEAVIQRLGERHRNEITAINIGRPELVTAHLADTDLKVATTRIGGAIARGKEPKEVNRLMNSYKGVLGASTDEVTKQVEDYEVNYNARDYADQIQVKMFDASKADKVAELKTMTDDPRVVSKGISHINKTHNDYAAAQSESLRNYKSNIGIILNDNPGPVGVRKAQETNNLNANAKERAAGQKLIDAAYKHPKKSTPGARERYQQMRLEGATDTEIKEELFMHMSSDDWSQAESVYKTTNKKSVQLYLDRLEKITLKGPDGIIKKGNADQIEAATTEFMQEMNEWILDFSDPQTGKGRPPTQEELKEHENWMIEEVIYDSDRWPFEHDETVYRFQFEEKDAADVEHPPERAGSLRAELEERGMQANPINMNRLYRERIIHRQRPVPPEERADIIKAIQASKRTPTEPLIIQTYNNMLKSKGYVE